MNTTGHVDESGSTGALIDAGGNLPTEPEGDVPHSVEYDPQYLPQLLWTPEVERATSQALNWVVSDMPGGAFVGLPLTGKSHFILYAKKVLPLLLGGSVAVVHWSFLGFMNGGKEDMLRLMMLQAGDRAVAARSPAILEGRLVDHLLELSQAFGARRLVVFVDEMQELPEELYPVVRSVTGRVQQEGPTVCVISVGQVSLADQIDQMNRDGQLSLTGRFFQDLRPFHALSVNDAIETLSVLDGPTRAFSARWLPHLHAKGWSLEQLAAPLRESMARLTKEKGLAQEALLPLGHFRPAFRRMVRMLAAAGDDCTGLSAEHVYACICDGNYPQLMQHYVRESHA